MSIVRAAAVLCAVVAVGAVIAAWVEERPHLAPEDAKRFTEEALGEAGLRSVRVAPVVRPGIAKSDDEGEIAVWVTQAAVQGGTVELAVDQASAQAVEVTPQPDTLLDEDGFEALDDYARDPVQRERIERNATATGAGVFVFVASIGFVLWHRRGRRWLATT